MSNDIINFSVTLSRGMDLDGEMATRDIVNGAIIRACPQSVGLVKTVALEVDL